MSPEERAPAAWVEPLRRTLAEAGFETALREEGRALVVEARREDDAPGFAIYVRLAEPEGPEEMVEPFRPRAAALRDSSRNLIPVLLDFVPERELYLGLPPGQRRAPGVTSFRAQDLSDYLEQVQVSEAGAGAFEPRGGTAYPFFEGMEVLGASFSPAGQTRKVIGTGFAARSEPESLIAPERTLDPGADYLFWFKVGTETEESIEVADVSLPEELEDGAVLDVVLFDFPDELELVGPTSGSLRVTPDGGATIEAPAFMTDDLDEGFLEETLLFAVRTPGRIGRHRLRCNLYFGSTLLQSRLVTVQVGGRVAYGERGAESSLDYRLTSSIKPGRLATMPKHDLSLSVNGNGSTHQFRFYGEDGAFRNEASLASSQVDAAIKKSRGALRMVAWGTEAEWNGDADAYRYRSTNPSRAQLTTDLGRLALAGANIYSLLGKALAGGVRARRQLEALTARPGKVQIASGPEGLYVPANLFYDHKVKKPERSGFTFCERFAKALEDLSTPLEECPCIAEGCPNREEPSVVCPSGFWGFRHAIGWPTSSSDAPAHLEFSNNPKVLIGISTDSALRGVQHAADIKALAAEESAEVYDDLELLDKAMLARESQLIYLYCHGGMDDGLPYVELGRPGSKRNWITYEHLRQGSPWGKPPPRPVVFINGCHTTALGPSEILDLVSGFVEEAEAGGVIGTELTVFDSLARAFSTTTLEQFLGGAEIGAAIRTARLEALRGNNPLGLIYIPFIAAETRLVAAS